MFTYRDDDQQDTLSKPPELDGPPGVQSVPELPELPPTQSPRPQARPEPQVVPEASDIEQERPGPSFTYRDPEGIPVEDKPEPKGPSYSANDLTRDEFFQPISNYMEDRFGVDSLRDYTREEVVSKYLNNMRGFYGGNSVRAFNELSYLNSKGDEELGTAKEAYAVYEGMESVFGDTTLAEKAGAVGDFVRGAVADPVNLVSFGVGKLAASGGTKVATKTAQKAAMKRYTQVMASKGLTGAAKKEAAQTAAEEVFAQTLKQVAKENTATVASRAAARKAAGESLKGKMTSSAALRQIGASTAVDTAFAVGADVALQTGLLRTGNQEEYSKFSTGLAAFGGLVMGGVAAGNVALQSPNRLNLPSVDTPKPQTQSVVPNLTSKLVKNKETWGEMVEKGTNLQDIPYDVYLKMMLGDDELGVEGLVHSMVEEGFQYNKELDGNVGQFVGNALKQTDPEDAGKLLQTFRNELGIEVPASWDMNDFADLFAYKVNQGAKAMNSLSQASKKLKKSQSELTIGDALEANFGPEIPGATKVDEVGDAIEEATGEGLKNFQNNVIRAIVSNPSTTMLNISGWAQAAGINSVTDFTMGLALAGKSATEAVLRSPNARKTATRAKALLTAQKTRAQNMVDWNTTYDAFMSYTQMRPKQTAELTFVLPGGVEDIQKVLKENGFTPRTKATQAFEEYIDAAQFMSGVKAQDMYTKSQEFVYQLDKELRSEFGQGWSEFFARPDARKIMNTKDYANLEGKALYETKKSIFSESYKGQGPIGNLAGAIEDARNLPGVGLMVPFGRFFNNTLAFMADSSGLSFASKMANKAGVKSAMDSPRSAGDLFTRAAISYGLVASMAEKEKENIEAGLNWDETIDDSTGGVESYRYEFPTSIFKAAARVKALKEMGREIPAELSDDIFNNVIGQFTRQLEASGGSIEEFGKSILEFELGDTAEVLAATAGGVTKAVVSGSTRPLDPLNQAIGMARGEDFSVMDRRQGSQVLNESLRYMDQFIGATVGDLAPEKNDAASDTYEGNVDRYLAPRRENIGMKATEKLMNLLGKQPFKAGNYSDFPEADNEYNRVFHEAVNEQARRLINTEEFQKASFEKRRWLAEETVLGPARDFTKELMEVDVQNTGSEALAIQLDLMQYAGDKRQKAMDELGLTEDPSEMTLDNLKLLQNYLSNRDEFLRFTKP